MENFTLTRRRFLINLTVFGAALPLAVGRRSASAAGSYVPVGSVHDFQSGEFKRVVLPDNVSVYIGTSSDAANGYLALSSKCTHRACEVLWISESKQFRCPCHGGRFDAAGTNVAGPPKSPLPSFPVKVENETVYVKA